MSKVRKKLPELYVPGSIKTPPDKGHYFDYGDLCLDGSLNGQMSDGAIINLYALLNMKGEEGVLIFPISSKEDWVYFWDENRGSWILSTNFFRAYKIMKRNGG